MSLRDKASVKARAGSVVEPLPSMDKALVLIPNTTTNNNKTDAVPPESSICLQTFLFKLHSPWVRAFSIVRNLFKLLLNDNPIFPRTR